MMRKCSLFEEVVSELFQSMKMQMEMKEKAITK